MNKLEIKKFNFDSIKDKINDSSTQFAAFQYYKNDQKIKAVIKENPLVTLEEYLNKTTEEIDKVIPGICEKYNDYVNKFMDPDISFEDMKDIINKVYNLTHKL